METGIARLLAVSCLMAALATGVGNAEVPPVAGTWIIRDLVLNIFDCQRQVCGQIVGIKDAARRQSQCGKMIVWGLAAKGPNEWGEGSILDPDDGRTYRLSATFAPDGTLRARIFEGVPLFGKTEVLQRIDIRSFTGRC